MRGPAFYLDIHSVFVHELHDAPRIEDGKPTVCICVKPLFGKYPSGLCKPRLHSEVTGQDVDGKVFLNGTNPKGVVYWYAIFNGGGTAVSNYRGMMTDIGPGSRRTVDKRWDLFEQVIRRNRPCLTHPEESGVCISGRIYEPDIPGWQELDTQVTVLCKFPIPMYVPFGIHRYSGLWQFLMVLYQKGHERPCRVRIHRIGSVLQWKLVQIVYAIRNFDKPCAPGHADDFGHRIRGYGSHEKTISMLQFMNICL